MQMQELLWNSMLQWILSFWDKYATSMKKAYQKSCKKKNYETFESPQMTWQLLKKKLEKHSSHKV